MGNVPSPSRELKQSGAPCSHGNRRHERTVEQGYNETDLHYWNSHDSLIRRETTYVIFKDVFCDIKHSRSVKIIVKRKTSRWANPTGDFRAAQS